MGGGTSCVGLWGKGRGGLSAAPLLGLRSRCPSKRWVGCGHAVFREGRRTSLVVFSALSHSLLATPLICRLQALSLASFLKPMLEFSPERRATAQQMLQHPWLKGETAGTSATTKQDGDEEERRGSGGRAAYPPPPPVEARARYTEQEDAGKGRERYSKVNHHRSRSRSGDDGSRKRSPGRSEREQAQRRRRGAESEAHVGGGSGRKRERRDY